eukprot:m.253617 g.253617  ORF g.253617 m.253617 type:complete len:65 (+) comp40372_c1_seq4:735-929(+)
MQHWIDDSGQTTLDTQHNIKLTALNTLQCVNVDVCVQCCDQCHAFSIMCLVQCDVCPVLCTWCV